MAVSPSGVYNQLSGLRGQLTCGSNTAPKRFPFGTSPIGGSIVAGARTHVSEPILQVATFLRQRPSREVEESGI